MVNTNLNKSSSNILSNIFSKIKKIIIKHKIFISVFMFLIISYLLILFSTRKLDNFQNCDELRSDLTLLQGEKQSLREQISNLEQQATIIEEECDSMENNLIAEKEELVNSIEEANSKYADVNERYNNLLEEYNVLVNENTSSINNMEQQITELQNNLRECNTKCSESFQNTENRQVESEENLNEDNNELVLALLRHNSDSILRNSRRQEQMNKQKDINQIQDNKLRRLYNILYKKYM